MLVIRTDRKIDAPFCDTMSITRETMLGSVANNLTKLNLSREGLCAEMDEYAVRHEHADRQLMTLNSSRTSPLNSFHRRVLGVLMYEELHGRDCSVITITCLQAREIQDIRRLLTSFTASLNDRKNTLVLTSVRVHHEAFIEEDFQTWKHLMVRCFPSFVDSLEMEQICAVVLPSSPQKHVPASYSLSDVSICSSGHLI